MAEGHGAENHELYMPWTTELDLPTTPRLNDLRRVVQEAVGNACRHGSPSSVTIRLSREGETLAVVIEDDGVGFDSSQGRSGGMGLRNMRERARRLNGTIAIESSHRGPLIILRVPFTSLTT
jgi:signal transduction histidine kinase